MFSVITYWVAVTLVCAPIVFLMLLVLELLVVSEVKRVTKGELRLPERVNDLAESMNVWLLGVLVTYSGLALVLSGVVYLHEGVLATTIIHKLAMLIEPCIIYVLPFIVYYLCSSAITKGYFKYKELKQKLDKL